MRPTKIRESAIYCTASPGLRDCTGQPRLLALVGWQTFPGPYAGILTAFMQHSLRIQWSYHKPHGYLSS